MTPTSVPVTALVTGASRGIGRAVAVALGAAGYRVAVLSRRRTDLDSLVAALPAGSIGLGCDLSRPEALSLALAELRRDLGVPSVIVNNAGLGGPFHRVDQVAAAEWDEIFRINLGSVQHILRELLPDLRARGYGRIINISSIQGLFGGALSSTYAATKHGLIGLTRSVAAEWGRYGITCNAICPGYTETDMLRGLKDEELKQRLLRRIPAQRFAQPEEIAALAVFLAGPLSGYINGAAIPVDGGLSTHLADALPEIELDIKLDTDLV